MMTTRIDNLLASEGIPSRPLCVVKTGKKEALILLFKYLVISN